MQFIPYHKTHTHTHRHTDIQIYMHARSFVQQCENASYTEISARTKSKNKIETHTIPHELEEERRNTAVHSGTQLIIHTLAQHNIPNIQIQTRQERASIGRYCFRSIVWFRFYKIDTSVNKSERIYLYIGDVTAIIFHINVMVYILYLPSHSLSWIVHTFVRLLLHSLYACIV